MPAYYVQLVVLFAVVLPLLRGIHYWRSDLYVYLYNALAHAQTEIVVTIDADTEIEPDAIRHLVRA